MFGIVRLLVRYRVNSPPAVKMMHGAVARTDLDAVRRSDGARDVALGGVYGVNQRHAFGEACGDGRRKRTAGAVGVGGCKSRPGKPDDAVSIDQEIDALGAA